MTTKLIEQSKQKDSKCFMIISGTKIADYVSITIEKEIGEKKLLWHIKRGIENHFVKNFICFETIVRNKETRRMKLYENNFDFELAIKRIENKIK